MLPGPVLGHRLQVFDLKKDSNILKLTQSRLVDPVQDVLPDLIERFWRDKVMQLLLPRGGFYCPSPELDPTSRGI